MKIRCQFSSSCQAYDKNILLNVIVKYHWLFRFPNIDRNNDGFKEVKNAVVGSGWF